MAIGTSGIAGCQNGSDCPPLLYVDETNESEVNASGQGATPFSQLSEKRKQEFTQALENGDAELDETDDAWTSTYFVEYQGDYYATAVAVC
ncbi:hypothetical protein [Haloarcula amylovorans]|uniref:hypothetical protein n=1 Tax=Haloarcula amylovorans TaxID=2562280 RepID=UPI001075D2CF|nr:hypothetical protein [Halomicroarcula amylolytica]